jgi:hypothetical protein
MQVDFSHERNLLDLFFDLAVSVVQPVRSIANPTQQTTFG